MSGAKRWILWIVLLAAAAGLVVFDRLAPAPSTIVEAAPARGPGAAAANASTAAAPTILKIRSRTEPADVDNAFAVRDWRPPPPPPKPVPTALPSKPTAPPFPYSVFGKQFADGVWQVFLRRDERILVVKPQETIDNAFRVDEIRPPTMMLTYLPLQQRVSLPIGGAE